MSAPVFLADPADVARAAQGETFTLRGDEGHHAAVVQRRRAGEEIHITDGDGTRLCGIITAVTGKEVSIAVQEVLTEPPANPQITLVQALIKGGGDEALSFATEAGVDVVIPWQADRAISRWSAEKQDKNRQKWQTTVLQAAKQARRAFVPTVRDVVYSRRLAMEIEEFTEKGSPVLLAHEEATQRIPDVIDAVQVGDEVMILIGPEGGFSDDEVVLFVSAGAQQVSIGPHVLRAVHAGGLAVALVRNAA